MLFGIANEELQTFEDHFEEAANKCAYLDTSGYFEVYEYENLKTYVKIADQIPKGKATTLELKLNQTTGEISFIVQGN